VELTAAYFGVLVLPVVFGFVATYISMALIPVFIAALVIAMVISTTLLNRVNHTEDS
jgi:ABC-type multidrug transport system permease subunit